MTLKELVGERAKILTQATEIAAEMRADGRDDLNAYEKAQIDRIAKRAVELETEIRAAEEGNAALASLENRATNANRNSRCVSPYQNRAHSGEQLRTEDSVEYHAYFNAALAGDHIGTANARQQLERRGLSLGTNTAGGYMSLPTALLNDFISNIDELSEVVSMATKIDIGEAKSLNISLITARGNDADWTGEITSVTADTSLALGARNFTPWMLTKEVDASMSLLQRSPQAQPIIFKQLARLFAVTLEKAALTGSGSSQPTGIFTAVSAGSGIDTSRDVTTASPTAITYADLVAFKYSLKNVYQKNAKLFIHRLFMQKALSIVDGNGRPIFTPSPAPGLADTILGMPVAYSEFAPDTFAATDYVAAYGDPEFYYFAYGMPYSMQVADQINARTNQVAFFGRTEVDGAPTLAEAFSRLIMHS